VSWAKAETVAERKATPIAIVVRVFCI